MIIMVQTSMGQKYQYWLEALSAVELALSQGEVRVALAVNIPVVSSER